nr:photosystem I reaction center subunit M [Lygodium flexuosum]UYS92441.1 photosystem I reaction center subunit M [Lygodium flexuosum]
MAPVSDIEIILALISAFGTSLLAARLGFSLYC